MNFVWLFLTLVKVVMMIMVIMIRMKASLKISSVPRWRWSTTEESSEEPTLQRLLPLELMGWTILEIYCMYYIVCTRFFFSVVNLTTILRFPFHICRLELVSLTCMDFVREGLKASSRWSKLQLESSFSLYSKFFWKNIVLFVNLLHNFCMIGIGHSPNWVGPCDGSFGGNATCITIMCLNIFCQTWPNKGTVR